MLIGRASVSIAANKGAVSVMNGIQEYDYFRVKPMIKRKKAAEAALKFSV